jgi:DNA-binding protein HU-beta
VPNKAQFIELLSQRLDGDKKKAAAALDAVIDTVYSAIAKGEQVTLTGFGIFERRERAARTARNPATGASVKVKKRNVPAFRPGAEFKAIASGSRKIAKAPARKASTTAKAATKAAPAKASTAKKAAKKSPATKTTARRSTAKKSR